MWEQRLWPWRNSNLEDNLLDAWILCWKHTELLGYRSFRQVSWVSMAVASPLGHFRHSWGAPTIQQQQAENVPASWFMTGIWIASSLLLACSTDFPPASLAGCGKGRLRW